MEKYAREGVDVSAGRYDGYADSLATDTLDSHVDDLPRIGEDARSFHIFSGAGRSNSSQCERAWMDADGSLVFDDAPELRAPFARECLRLHPDELLSLARAVFAFEYQATGGASLLRLPQMLAYYRSADFVSYLGMLRRF